MLLKTFRSQAWKFVDDSTANSYICGMIDAKDKEILTLLLQDAAISKADIARRVGLAPSAISERVRKLEADDVIQGYEVRLNPHALGKSLLAVAFVTDA